MRLIDADALRDKVLCDGIDYDFVDFLQDIDDAPTVETVRHGRWIEETDRRYHWHCSECLTVQGVSSKAMKYCPACGAKITEE